VRRVGQILQRAGHTRALDQERWDRQLDRDASSGKLFFLQDEARSERDSGTLKDWPALSR